MEGEETGDAVINLENGQSLFEKNVVCFVVPRLKFDNQV